MSAWGWFALAVLAMWALTLEFRYRDLEARIEGVYVLLRRSIDECMSRHPAGRNRGQR